MAQCRVIILGKETTHSIVFFSFWYIIFGESRIVYWGKHHRLRWSSGCRSCDCTSRFVWSSPAEDDELLRPINTTSFGGLVKPSGPSRKIWRMLKNPRVNEHCGIRKRYFVGEIHGNFSSSFSCFVTSCIWWLMSEFLNSDGERTIDQ
jgi:hypothetical protein